MEKTIKVQIKSNYGNQAVYVVSEHKEAIKKITKRETLTQSDIEGLKLLGFTFEQVTELVKI